MQFQSNCFRLNYHSCKNMTTKTTRTVGATLDKSGTCRWRVWAPLARNPKLILVDRSGKDELVLPLEPDANGYFIAEQQRVVSGQRYVIQLGQEQRRPDPASSSQPDGVHAPSAVWSPDGYEWTDIHWKGRSLQELVIYELHVGTFTREGTFAAAIGRLEQLRDLGVTAIELMPVGQFPGNRGWGYDGTYWFAVQHSYGGPTELQRFVDACHYLGLAVILDVVYNHFGPEGNYIAEFGPYFSDKHHTPWGNGIDFDEELSRPVRDFVLDNTRHWMRNFHIDGFRLDAIHAINDDSPTHILAEIKRVANEEAEQSGRLVLVIAESNLNDVKLLDSEGNGGYSLDAQWSDDFHHCVHALLTGERDGYYADFHEPASQLLKSLSNFFVHDGCYSQFRGANHGGPIGEHSGEKFIISIQTHDQVGNRAIGDRFGTLLSPKKQRLAAGLLLLSPNIPMLFMGEEYGETSPFPFFCDFGDEGIREAVRRGRREEFSSFAWQDTLPDPLAKETFESAILSWAWPSGTLANAIRNLYQELLRIRVSYPAFRNYRDRQAEFISAGSDSAREALVQLTRSDANNPNDQIITYFNLTDDRLKLPPPNNEDEKSLLLHSEESRFGGVASVKSNPFFLEPFAFVVFRLQRKEKS